MEKREKKKISIKDIGIGRLGLIVLAGIVLILCSLPLGQSTSGKKESDTGAQEKTENDMAEIGAALSYRDSLEKEVEELLGRMEGVGQVKVMIHISRTSEKVLKEDSSVDTEDTEETDSQGGSRSVTTRSEDKTVIYTVDGNGHEVPYVVLEKMPVIDGIAVVAKGGGNASVKSEVTALLEALFHLEANQISVSQMEENLEN